MRASFIVTLVVVATAFFPTLCAPLDSPLTVRDSATNFKHIRVRAVSARQDGPDSSTGYRILEPHDPNTFSPQSGSSQSGGRGSDD
ncbi:hypothetical protein V8E53_009120 [Lactarius tabidus]